MAEESLSEDEVLMRRMHAGVYSLHCSVLVLGNLWIFVFAARLVESVVALCSTG